MISKNCLQLYTLNQLYITWERKSPVHEINSPQILAEVSAAHERYEQALSENNIDVLDELFWENSLTLRYGIGENLYGHDQISIFRRKRETSNLDREILKLTITTFGKDFATTNLEFKRLKSDQIGRQSQTWLRTEKGWKIVSAHVSLMREEKIKSNLEKI
ncbi:MAG: DUF4440 domain-containing protein [Alphaproteobacteria bacterium]|jgi:hypothetical protein|nr:DUF4440 domain-containing protein [Alphaproteobacteria bacterium]